MPLSVQQRTELKSAITTYGFAPRYIDFLNGIAVSMPDMATVERVFRDMLASANTREIRYGLANVMVWGDAELNDRSPKVLRLLAEVSRTQLGQFKDAVAMHGVPTLPLLSKIAAFLDPKHYCILDRTVTRLAAGCGARGLHGLPSGAQLAITRESQAAYDAWRHECRSVSTDYFGNSFRAVDVERGFVQLITSGQLDLAQSIYVDA